MIGLLVIYFYVLAKLGKVGDIKEQKIDFIERGMI
jgi:hypothetical protein